MNRGSSTTTSTRTPSEEGRPMAWLTDFVGYLPMPDRGGREAFVAADYNADMIEQIARHGSIRDRSIFVGNPDDIVPRIDSVPTFRSSVNGPRPTTTLPATSRGSTRPRPGSGVAASKSSATAPTRRSASSRSAGQASAPTCCVGSPTPRRPYGASSMVFDSSLSPAPESTRHRCRWSKGSSIGPISIVCYRHLACATWPSCKVG